MGWVRFLIVLTAFWLWAAPVFAQARLALVIGNSEYQRPGWALKNPVNDARLIAARLRALGFTVTPVENATKAQLEAAMNAFAGRLRAAGPDAVGVFYYAGHATEHDGANLLVPVDIAASSTDELRFRAPPMQFLLRDMARAGNAVNIVILDACRDLPLPAGARSGPAGGLADFADVPDNVLIAYATGPGLTAPDNPSEGNSVFTRTLAAALEREAATPVESLFASVQARVFTATGQTQRPEFRASLLRAPGWRFRDATPPPVDPELERLRRRNAELEAERKLAEAERERLASLSRPAPASSATAPGHSLAARERGEPSAPQSTPSRPPASAPTPSSSPPQSPSPASGGGVGGQSGVKSAAEIWRAGARPVVKLTLTGHDGAVFAAAFSWDGATIVTTGSDRTARLWDARSGGGLVTFREHKDMVFDAAFSPDSSQLVTVSGVPLRELDNTARVWSAGTGKEAFVLSLNSSRFQSAAFSPDGARIVTANSGDIVDYSIGIWDARAGHNLLTFRSNDPFAKAAFSPDGGRIVTGGQKSARIWDARTGRQLLQLEGHTNQVHLASYSPQGTHIVTGSFDRTARVWDSETGRHLFTLTPHGTEVRSANFSPDGSRIVTASHKGARVWDAQTGVLLCDLKEQHRVNSAAFSPDGTRIVTASGDGTARVWEPE